MQPLLHWKEQYSECVYVAFGIQHVQSHAQYCHLWPVPVYNIFAHYHINGTIFEKKKLLNIKFLFRFAL